MTQSQQETRQDEIARVQGYLKAQAVKRNPEQLVEALREAQRQLVEATDHVPESAFRTPPADGEWAAADVLEHVTMMAAIDERSILAAALGGERPGSVRDQIEKAPADATKAQMLAQLEGARTRLIDGVVTADPDAHLDLTWSVSDFGQLNWREVLLFARVHTLDHAKQMQAIAEAVQGTEMR
ncbi:MAG: DinB family protein [Dehalococcoidia bacterium]